MLKIKPYKQKPSYCGPSCLKMVFDYYGVKKSERELGKLADTTVAKGTRAEGLIRAARHFDFDGFIKDNATFADIKKYVLKKKIPVIVNWFYETEGHYSVVVGIDKKKIYLQDPWDGKVISLSLSTFMTVWFDFVPPYLTKKSRLFIRRMIVIAPRQISPPKKSRLRGG